MSYSLVSPFFALISETHLVAASTVARRRTGETKTNTPRQTTQAAQETRWRAGELLVHFKHHAPVSKISALLKQNRAHWNGQLRGQSGIVRLRLSAESDPETMAAVLRASELIDFAEPNYLIVADQTSPNDPRFSEQWTIQNTRASQAWATSTGSKQTVIAVVDSGIDFTHPDLGNNGWDNSLEQANNHDDDSNGFADDLHGWDFVTNSSGIIDEQGHGTAVAGIIAAQGNNSIGVTGIMWRASLMSLRVLDSAGTGDIARAVEAIDYAVENGAQVINCSWGTDDASLALREAIKRAAERGVVVVTSAGNQGRDIETTPRYPASYDLSNLISVASTDNNDLLTPFSNWGMMHASIAAPGKDILTTRIGGDYQTVSGSSASAPFVSGVVGLVKTLRPWLGADHTREMIIRGARQAPSLSDKVASKGIVNAAGTLEALNILPPNEGLDERGSNSGGEHGNNGNGRRNQRDNISDAGNTNGNYNRDGSEFSVTPPARTTGAPGLGLPNLDELRRKQPINPKAPDPVPSTRCSHKDPDCASIGRQAALESSIELLALSQNLPALDSLLGDNSRPISDSPFRLFWSRPALSSTPLLPQTTRTNVALASNGAVASASSQHNSNQYPASGAINGDRKGLGWGNGGGWNDNTQGSFPDWLQIDFQGSKTIDEIDVFTLQDNYQSPSEPTEAMTFSLYGITNFQVQYWNGAGWADVAGGNVTGNNKVWRKFTFSGITTNKIRVLVNNALLTHSRIVEVEAWGTAPPRTNVALAANGATASASSTHDSNLYPASATINGDRKGGSAGWWNDNTQYSFPDWLQVNFNGSKTIDEINVFTVQDNYTNPSEPTEAMTFSLYGVTAFDVQFWNGSAWVTVPNGSVTGNNKVWKKFTFSPITTSKIRVLINNALLYYSRLTEVEAWGIAGSSDPSGNNYSMGRIDSINRTGSGGVDLLSGNANWSLPILGLKGRAGLDLNLALFYNSLVWTKDASSNSIKFDADRGMPSPGFRLGFPVIQAPYYNSQVGKNAYLLITPSGARVELRQVGTSNVYEAGDSSYLQLIDNGNGSLMLKPTDGSQLSYNLKTDQYQCTQVKDRNGNYITISYYTDGRINTITDTLSRVVTFNYDGFLNLISITQMWGGATHTWATFGWSNLTIQTNFSNMTVTGPPNGTIIPVLTQVGFADGSHYKFNYTSWGQVYQIAHYGADEGLRNWVGYNLPGSEWLATSAQSDCPRFTEQKNWAENWNNSLVATTSYSTASDYSSGQVTMPDGTVYKELFATSGWQKGLTTGTEVWSAGVKKKWTTSSYTQDDTTLSYQKNPRVTETNIYDVEGNRKRTTVEYGIYAQWGLPYLVKEYAVNGVTVIRQTLTDYNLSQAYLDRRIIGLVSAVSVSDSAVQAKTSFEYDAGGDQLQATPSATTQHDSSYGASLTVGRGNLTSVSRYDVTDINNESQKLVTRMGYDTNGSVIFTRDHLGHQSKVSYIDSFSDGVNRNTFAYPTMATDPAEYSSTTKYNYYFGAVTRTQSPPPAGQTEGAIQTFEYNSAGRISRVNNVNNGAYRRWVYDPTGAVSTFETINTVAQETFSTTLFDGLGRVRATGGDNPNSAGGYRAQFTIYGVMGRAIQSANPAETNSDWIPTGDDALGWVWTQQQYDWKGRPTVTILPSTDGGQTSPTREITYGGCGCAGGEVATIRDEVGRRQRVTSDILGRPLKTEVLNWDQTVYSTTTNNYNVRDQVTSVIEAGANASQTTTLTYDGYGRLKTKHAPSQTNTIIYAYNSDDTVKSVTDARGAVATFTYNNRHLATNITYTAPSGIATASPVSFSYDAAGNRTAMTDGTGSTSYVYDQLSRLTSETRQLNGLSGSYSLTYTYNLSGGLTNITDQWGDAVGYQYDQVGRVSAVTGAGFANVSSYASNLKYRAWGAIKQISYGNGLSLSMGYDARLRATSYVVPGVLSKSYDYQADSRLGFSHDAINPKFDRSYTYDHVGRITQALSGAEARGEGATNQRPYKQTFIYDSFNHLTQRPINRVWSGAGGEFSPSVQSYQNNRNTAWQYDANGHLIDSGDVQYTMDASGQASRIISDIYLGYTLQSSTWGVTTDVQQSFDGQGGVTKKVETTTTHDNEMGDETTGSTTYYLRSSVLGGKVITELDELGQKARGFVYLGNSVLAWQQKSGTTESVLWEHRDSSNASFRVTNSNAPVNSVQSAELDPLGTDAGISDPQPPLQWKSMYPGFGSSFASSDSQCMLDHVMTPCSTLTRAMEVGATSMEYLFHDGKGWHLEQYPIIPLGLGRFVVESPVVREDEEGPYLDTEEVIFSSHAPQDKRTTCERMADDAQRISAEITKIIKLGVNDLGNGLAIQGFNQKFGMITFGSYFRPSPWGFLGTSPISRNNVLGTRDYQGQDGFAPQFFDESATSQEQPNPDQVHHFGAYFSAGLAGHKVIPDQHRADDREQGHMGDVRLSDQSRRLGDYLRKNPTQLSNVGQLIRDTICAGKDIPK